MPFIFDGVRYPGLSEFIASSPGLEAGRGSGKEAPPYAHPMDRGLIQLLDKTMLTPAVADWLDSVLTGSQGQKAMQNLTISSRNYPEAHESVVECARLLGLSTIPHVYVSSYHGMNAMTSGTNEYAYIEITSGILNRMSPTEQKFVIGHECGHLAAGHVIYRSMANLLVSGAARPLGLVGAVIHKTLQFPLAAWSRRAEITADRAGLICCGSLSAAEQALVRLLVPSGAEGRIDVDDYLRRVEQITEIQKPGLLAEIGASHPMISRRIKALRLFARSELYYRVTGVTPPSGVMLLTDRQLNHAVSEVVNI